MWVQNPVEPNPLLPRLASMPAERTWMSPRGEGAPNPHPSPDRLRWRTSTASDPGDCVEVALAGRRAHLRDSKHQQGPTLRLGAREWVAFIAHTRGRADGTGG